MAGLLGAGMPDTGLLSPATVNPLMARKAAAQRSLLPVDSPFQQYNASYPQTWGQFGQNMAQAYPTPATGGTREQIMAAVKEAAVNAGPLMTVYHGSPHRFDKFDASKIGTGEGHQAYGHGLYFAEKKGVADQYKNALSGSDFVAADGSVAYANKSMGRGGVTPETRAADALENAFYSQSSSPYAMAAKSVQQFGDGPNSMQALKVLEDWQAKGVIPKPGGSLYKVDLPDEHIAKMLDWDKPLSQQPELLKAVFDNGLQHSLYKVDGSKNAGDFTGSELVRALGGNAAASERLGKMGIPGIRYLDGGSRSGGAGTSNFVVFPGNEGLLKILDRN